MHDDVRCPYCDGELEIDHDDGQGYAENETHHQYCPHCEKYFAFTTIISFSYDAHKADCLNDGEHKWEATYTYPVVCTKMECVDCGETRKPTDDEMKKIIKERGESPPKKKEKEKSFGGLWATLLSESERNHLRSIGVMTLREIRKNHRSVGDKSVHKCAICLEIAKKLEVK